MSQRISIRKELDQETAEEFEFASFDFDIVFIGYRIESKPKGKRNWKTVKFWDKYSQRDSTIEEPVLSLGIRAEVLEKAQSLIKIKTWNEFKS